ncbi:hypothetical protein HN51_032378, partial [Arachis hypogaea]
MNHPPPAFPSEPQNHHLLRQTTTAKILFLFSSPVSCLLCLTASYYPAPSLPYSSPPYNLRLWACGSLSCPCLSHSQSFLTSLLSLPYFDNTRLSVSAYLLYFLSISSNIVRGSNLL